LEGASDSAHEPGGVPARGFGRVLGGALRVHRPGEKGGGVIADFGFGIVDFEWIKFVKTPFQSAIRNYQSAIGAPCLYRRVLVSAQANGTKLPAWLYVVGDRWTRSVKELTGGIWR